MKLVVFFPSNIAHVFFPSTPRCEVLMALDASLILASAGQAPREVSGCGVTGWVLYP